jgi:hypothetical protein
MQNVQQAQTSLNCGGVLLLVVGVVVGTVVERGLNLWEQDQNRLGGYFWKGNHVLLAISDSLAVPSVPGT